MGNLIGAAISNVYYPADDSTVNGTIERGVTVTVEGAVGAELIEFWPDVVRHYKRKRRRSSRASLPREIRSAAPIPRPPLRTSRIRFLRRPSIAPHLPHSHTRRQRHRHVAEIRPLIPSQRSFPRKLE